jgi:hypothetical protein
MNKSKDFFSNCPYAGHMRFKCPCEWGYKCFPKIGPWGNVIVPCRCGANSALTSNEDYCNTCSGLIERNILI